MISGQNDKKKKAHFLWLLNSVLMYNVICSEQNTKLGVRI